MIQRRIAPHRLTGLAALSGLTETATGDVRGYLSALAHTGHMAETKLDVMRRHVAERHKRIRRQEALIERVIVAGDPDVMEQAGLLLAGMRQAQVVAEAEVAQYEESEQPADTSGLAGDPNTG